VKVTVWLKRHTLGSVCGRIAPLCGLGQGGFAVQQVEHITVRIGKEHHGVSMCRLRISKKTHTFRLQAGVDFGEIGDCEGEVAQSGGIHAGGGHGIGGGFDDFDHGAIGGFDEDGLAGGWLVVDDKIQMLDVPEGEAEWIRGGDGDVFDSGDHMRGL